MSIDEITDYLEGLGGVLTLEPRPGDGSPEISWGDRFFYYAPDGVVPKTQPFATIVTKDYPGDDLSRLDRPGAFRLNVAAGSDAFARWAGRDPHEAIGDDAIVAHPVYGALGWLAVVNPGTRTATPVRELLQQAHAAARARRERRAGVEHQDGEQ
ncbi:MAG TPA: DUF6194 family protein [Propionibacteriaceae bacterium]